MIRRLLPSDTDAVFAVVQAIQALDSTGLTGRPWSQAEIRMECEHGGWLEEDADGTVRSCVLMRDVVDAFEITFVATHPQVRRQGRMAALLRHALHDFRALQMEKSEIWLEVHESNVPARELYRRLGFRETGRRPRYYAGGGAAILYSYSRASG